MHKLIFNEKEEIFCILGMQNQMMNRLILQLLKSLWQKTIFWIDICNFWWKIPFFFVYFGHFLRNFWAFFLSKQCNDSLTTKLNHFLEKIKHWIESNRVSNTPILGWLFFVEMLLTRKEIAQQAEHQAKDSDKWRELESVTCPSTRVILSNLPKQNRTSPKTP